MTFVRSALAEQPLTFDLCIVGAGPAGISIAREFIGTELKVCLVESGGIAPSAAVQNLARGDTVGDPIHAPDTVCRRVVGGNATAWHVQIGRGRLGVRYMPLDEMDFEQRPGMAFSGWPFGRSALLPFYARAQAVCQSGPFAYEPDPWESRDARRLPTDATVLETTMFQFGPAAAFHRQYRDELVRSQNVRLLLQTSAVEIETGPDATAATRILCVGPGGRRLRISARAFVLATGGFENARLLLMSDKRDPRGLGNRHDVVGRYFHDHPLVFGGFFTPHDRILFDRTALYDLRQVHGFPVMGHLKLSNAVSREYGLPNLSACLFPRPDGGQTEAVLAFQDLLLGLRARRKPDNAAHLLRRAARHADAVAMASALRLRSRRLICTFAKGGWSASARNGRRYRTFHVFHQIEQTPDPANRVTLGPRRDALGCPTLEVHWRWSAGDAERVGRAQALMAAELNRAGLGAFEIARKDGQPDILRPSGTHHLMGTTRMHADPRLGVVDADCRVHGMENLFVAGSSVFPTGGYANPTLTIVALALRLADHLKARLARSVATASVVKVGTTPAAVDAA